MSYSFNVRVYGLLHADKEEKILLSSELVQQKTIIKFPGGGLQFGEGTLDGLKREWLEELQLPVLIHSHFYTTNFFQVSAFNSQEQIISIYYKVGVELNFNEMQTHINKLNREKKQERGEQFFFTSIKDLSTETLTFPIDKVVLEKLKVEVG